jgi:hypothetical protein
VGGTFVHGRRSTPTPETEIVHDVRDRAGDDTDVVDGQVPVAPDPERSAHVGCADADGQNIVAMCREGRRQRSEFGVSGGPQQHLSRLEDGHAVQLSPQLIGQFSNST